LPTSSERALEVRSLAKHYRLGERASLHGSLRDAIGRSASNVLRLGRRDRSSSEWIWALDHVDFDVERGEVLGIIGRNGAGKTTLLKVLSGITEPTEGEARIWGRVGSLLEVGTGFHPELTGRENIFLNAAILGMRRREILAKFDEIVEFAEVERFIDTPVKRFSTGMYLRLAFSVAAHLEPEILIVDEVLAVGDATFQRKCLGKMGEVSGEGRTVLLVSHNMSAITSLATRCLWLDAGRIHELGLPSEVVPAYLSRGHTADVPGFADLSHPSVRHGITKQTEKEILFDSVRLVDSSGETTGVFFEDEPMRIVIGLDSRIFNQYLEVVCKVSSLDGILVFTLVSGLMEVEVRPGRLEIDVDIPALPLRRGNYQIELYVLTRVAQDLISGAIEFEVAGARAGDTDPREMRDYLGLVNVEHEWGAIRPAESAQVSGLEARERLL
jgi:lipopolysaccharide transport system ATP-binding protein